MKNVFKCFSIRIILISATNTLLMKITEYGFSLLSKLCGAVSSFILVSSKLMIRQEERTIADITLRNNPKNLIITLITQINKITKLTPIDAIRIL